MPLEGHDGQAKGSVHYIPRCYTSLVRDPAEPDFWQVLAEFPLFVLRVFVNPRSLVRTMKWDEPATLQRLSLYTVVWLAIIVLAFSNNHRLSETKIPPRLSTFKGIVMRAHDRSWSPPPAQGAATYTSPSGESSPPGEMSVPEKFASPPPAQGFMSNVWLQPVYGVFHLGQGEAKRLWDTLLTSGFLTYTLLAGLIAIAVVARLRMWRFGLPWEQCIGTGILGYLAAVTCASLSLVPLGLLLICRHCGVRLALFILLNLAAWLYTGYFCLGDWSERPGGIRLLGQSLGYGLLNYIAAYLVFFVLILCIIPM